MRGLSLLQRQGTDSISLRIAWEIETADGQHKTMLDSATPIRDERGVIQGAAGILQDITERTLLMPFAPPR